MPSAIEAASQYIKASSQLCFFTGAGLSAESGIQTFRSHNEQDSLWAKYDPTELATPEAFNRDPSHVYAWYQWRREKLKQAKPNQAHRIIAQLQCPVITQNVDDLLERAQTKRQYIAHLHGTIGEDKCVNQGCDYLENIDYDNLKALRPCPKCNHWLRPNVVWFGEALPTTVWQQANTDLQRSDCLLVVGTSGVVYPAAGLVEQAYQLGIPVIVIDPNESQCERLASVKINLSAVKAMSLLFPTAC